MVVTLNTNFYIMIGTVMCLIIMLLCAYIISIRKYKYLLDEYYLERRQHLKRSNQISMIEYHYRAYKEGKNAFTVLRDIGEVISDDLEVGEDGH